MFSRGLTPGPCESCVTCCSGGREVGQEWLRRPLSLVIPDQSHTSWSRHTGHSDNNVGYRTTVLQVDPLHGQLPDHGKSSSCPPFHLPAIRCPVWPSSSPAWFSSCSQLTLPRYFLRSASRYHSNTISVYISACRSVWYRGRWERLSSLSPQLNCLKRIRNCLALNHSTKNKSQTSKGREFSFPIGDFPLLKTCVFTAGLVRAGGGVSDGRCLPAGPPGLHRGHQDLPAVSRLGNISSQLSALSDHWRLMNLFFLPGSTVKIILSPVTCFITQL